MSSLVKVKYFSLTLTAFFGVILFISLKVNAVEVNAIIYSKGQPVPMTIEVILPDNWSVIPSSDPNTMGDYLITKKKSAYMILRLTDWSNKSANAYSTMLSGNGYSAQVINSTKVFNKEITKDRRRFEIERFVDSKKMAVATTLSLYDDYLTENVDNEIAQASNIISKARITSTLVESNVVDPKIASSRKNVDNALAKIAKHAENGDVRKFPSICAKVDKRALKYSFPKAPQEIKDYYENATNRCRGALHTKALHSMLKKEGARVCEKMEVTLQINHIKAFTKKTNDMKVWELFISNFKQTCPDNLNF